MYRLPVRLAATILFTLLIGSFSPIPRIHAQSIAKGSLQVEPAYIEVTLEKADEEKTIEIFYTNHSTQALALDIFPIDFKQANERGGISLLGKDSGGYSYSLSSFLTFEANTVTVEPGEKRKFVVHVKNRQNLSPGGHYAAVIGKIVSTGEQTVVSPAISTLIFMKKLGGEKFSVSVTDVGWPKSLFVTSIPFSTEVTFQNEGNVHVVPYGRVEVTDMFGRLLYKGVLNTSSAIVMPESRRIIPLHFKKISGSLPLSIHALTIKGNDSLKKTQFVYQETFVYIDPLLFFALPIIGGVFWFWKKRKGSIRFKK